jgi:DNA polymerase III subunit gamma/tau
MRIWRRFADTIPEQGRITSFILSNTPQLTTETSFDVTVSNSLQQKELTRLQPDITSYLQFQLQNSLIRMNIKEIEETEMQKASSPEDRYKLMVDQNSALKTLRDGLNLEID